MNARARLLVPSLLPLACAALTTLTASPARADDDFGTTPARSATPEAAAPAKPPQAAEKGSGEAMPVAREQVESRKADVLGLDDEDVSGAGAVPRRRREAPLATDPPRDWAVAYAGLRPRLGTFGGLLTLGAAQSRIERFYGAASFATVRNDAGTNVSALQLALGRNLSHEFGGGLQLSLTENRARSFYGLGQATLAYNRAGEMVGTFQLAGYNRADTFTGLAQVGLYDRVDSMFAGIAQVGAFDHARDKFRGVAQIGLLTVTGPDILPGSDGRGSFAGVLQAGAWTTTDGDFTGVTQVGVASFTSRKFRGLLQVGAFATASEDFIGLAQLGAANFSKRSTGIQLGLASLSFREHTGVQLGAGYNYAREVAGAQVGFVNRARSVKGVQIGIYNETDNLEGVQIGLVNHAEDGLLPWTGIVNVGFGDGGGDDDVARARRGSRTM